MLISSKHGLFLSQINLWSVALFAALTEITNKKMFAVAALSGSLSFTPFLLARFTIFMRLP